MALGPAAGKLENQGGAWVSGCVYCLHPRAFCLGPASRLPSYLISCIWMLGKKRGQWWGCGTEPF